MKDLKLIFHSFSELAETEINLLSLISELTVTNKTLTEFGKFRLTRAQKSLEKIKGYISYCNENNKDFCYNLNGKPVSYDIINLLNK